MKTIATKIYKVAPNFWNAVGGTIAVVAFTGAMVGMVLHTNPDVTVYESNTTRECTKVKIKNVEHPCSVLEERGIEKYNHVWVN